MTQRSIDDWLEVIKHLNHAISVIKSLPDRLDNLLPHFDISWLKVICCAQESVLLHVFVVLLFLALRHLDLLVHLHEAHELSIDVDTNDHVRVQQAFKVLHDRGRLRAALHLADHDLDDVSLLTLAVHDARRRLALVILMMMVVLVALIAHELANLPDFVELTLHLFWSNLFDFGVFRLEHLNRMT